MRSGIQRMMDALVDHVRLSLPKRLDILAIQVGTGGILIVLLAGIMFVIEPMQILVVVASILVSIYFFTRPMFALFAVFGMRALLDLLWWIPGTIFGLNMMQLFSGAVFILVATQMFLDLTRVQHHPGFRLFLAYLVVMLIAVVRCDDLSGNVARAVRYLSPFVLFFMASIHFDTRGRRRALMILIAVVGVVPSALSLYHFGAGQMDTHLLHGFNRLMGGYKNLHNMALMTLLFSCVYVFWLAHARRNFQSLLMLGLVGLTLFAMYNTFIRTSMLGFAVFLAVFLIVERHYRVLAAFMVLAVLFVVFDANTQQRFSDIGLVFDTSNISLDKRTLGSGRWGMWSMSMTEYLRRPTWDIVLGLGLGGHLELTIDWVRMFHTKHTSLDPHNDFLLMLYQMGPVAVIAYIGLQVQVVRYAWRVRMQSPDRLERIFSSFVIALTAVVFSTNAVSNSFVHRTSPGWYYWCIAGLVFAQYRQIVAEQAEEDRVVPGELRPVAQPVSGA